MRLAFCSTVMAVALAACATFAETVVYSLPAGAPTAQVTLTRGNMLSRREGRIYIASTDGATRAALAPIGTSGYGAPFTIEAGSRLLFELETANVYRTETTDTGTTDCSEYYSFTPAAGASYRFTMSENDSACATVTVQDMKTGKEPADLKHEMAP